MGSAENLFAFIIPTTFHTPGQSALAGSHWASSFFLFLRTEEESNPGEHFTQEKTGTEPLDTRGRRLQGNMSLSPA